MRLYLFFIFLLIFNILLIYINWNKLMVIFIYFLFQIISYTTKKIHQMEVTSMKEEQIYFTINAVNMFHGIKPFKIGTIVKLVKEPENDYDMEAIRVELRYAGKSGYVANSVKTVAKGTYSAGRLYDKILEQDYGKIIFIIGDTLIAKILTKNELEKEKINPDSDINYI